jgi:colicin import membrane protein
MHVRWPRRQPGRPWTPGPATLIAVALVAFASAFGVARAAGSGDPSETSVAVKPQPIALRTASTLPAMNAPPGPTAEELAAKREARERARKRRLAKERKAAEEKAAREERKQLRAERRAQRAAERKAEAEAKRQAAAEKKKKAEERKRRQEQDAAPQPEQTTPEPPPPTSTTPVGEPFDDSG